MSKRERDWHPVFAAVAKDDVAAMLTALEGKAMGVGAVARRLLRLGRERRRFNGIPFVIVPLPLPEVSRRGACLWLRLWLLLRSPTWEAREGLPLHEWRGETVAAVRREVRALLLTYQRKPVLRSDYDFAGYLQRGIDCLEAPSRENPAVERQRRANESMFGDW